MHQGELLLHHLAPGEGGLQEQLEQSAGRQGKAGDLAREGQRPSLHRAPPRLAKHGPVSNQDNKTVDENSVVNSRGRAVYLLSGDSKSHAECTSLNGCFVFWPPVKVASRSSLSKAPGVPGKLGI